MKRIAAILIAITLLFSAGSAHADDTSEANKLFVEAVKLVKSAANAWGYEEKAAVLEEALSKLKASFLWRVYLRYFPISCTKIITLLRI